jgi:hypothetical protein
MLIKIGQTISSNNFFFPIFILMLINRLTKVTILKKKMLYNLGNKLHHSHILFMQ